MDNQEIESMLKKYISYKVAFSSILILWEYLLSKPYLPCIPQSGERYLQCIYLTKTCIYKWDKNRQLNRKMGKDLSVYFNKEDVQMANEYMTKCSVSLVIREMHIKTSMRYTIHHQNGG